MIVPQILLFLRSSGNIIVLNKFSKRRNPMKYFRRYGRLACANCSEQEIPILKYGI